MAITVEARTEIISLVVGMFGAAPGASVLSDLVASKEAGQSIKGIAASLANTAEFKSIFPTFLTNAEYATKVVDQLLAQASTTAKADAVAVLTAELNGGMTRSNAMVAAIEFVANTASTNTAYGTSAVAFDNKVAVATYYSVDKQLSGSSLQVLQNVIGAVTDTAASVTTAKSAVDVVQNPGSTFTFTIGVDDLKGASGDDVFNATITATSAVLGALDVADGGTGNDTINIVDTATAAVADFALPVGLVIKNIETMNVTTNGALGTTATALDLSGITGLTKFSGAAAGAGTATSSHVKVAGTTDAALTVAGVNLATVTGGQNVSIVAGTGVTNIIGNATGTSSASVKGGGVNTISGNSMKAVTLEGITGATSAITSTGVAELTLKAQTTALATTITNAVSTALTVNVDGAGYTTAGVAVAGVSVAAGAAAKAITLNATGAKSNVSVSGAAATTLNITGTADVTLSAAIATATKIDGSAAKGSLTLGVLNAATVTVNTGTGNDSLTLNATTKATVDTGAGNDTVTLASALATGSTINLGAGNDKLLAGGGGVTASTTTVIDGGDGTDTVSAQLINVGSAGLFKNFEQLNLDSTTGLDLALLAANNTILGLTMSSTSTTATYQNVPLTSGLLVDFVGNNSAFTNTLSFVDSTGTNDSYTVTFNGVNAGVAPVAANVQAGTIAAAGIENVNIVSGGTKAWNSVTLTDANAKTVTLSGAANLDATFAAFGTAGANGVSSIDGSAATGALNINTGGVGVATAGLTVKGGAGNDTITLTQKATVIAGAGNDTIVVAAAGATVTGGAGNDTFNVTAAAAGAAAAGNAFSALASTTILDASAGDVIQFANNGVETFTSVKVNVSTATALSGGTINALDLAAAGAGGANSAVTWFQYAGDTYVVVDSGAGALFTATDHVVKLAGLVDLSNAVIDSAANTLTLA